MYLYTNESVLSTSNLQHVDRVYYNSSCNNMSAIMATPHKILPDQDLSETQIYLTVQTYDRFPKEYAERWEWNPITIKETRKYNINPCIKYMKKRGTVLLIECQSGRDYAIFSKQGYRCLGTGSSYGLLTEAVRRVPNGIFLRLETRSLPFLPESFDAVYADALTSVPKRNLRSVLKDFQIFLKPSGMLYMSLKLGQRNVLEQRDLGGPRFFTLYRMQEIIDHLKNTGFRLTWSCESHNTDRALPRWISIIAKKI